MCIGYTSLMRAQASSYRNRLNALLGNAQSRGESLGGSRVYAVEDGRFVHLGVDEND